MTEGFAGLPEPRDQIAGLTFALLLLQPDLTIEQVNPAAENLIGRSARKLLGKKLLDGLLSTAKLDAEPLTRFLLGGSRRASSL